jgi:hypothetical protein
VISCVAAVKNVAGTVNVHVWHIANETIPGGGAQPVAIVGTLIVCSTDLPSVIVTLPVEPVASVTVNCTVPPVIDGLAEDVMVRLGFAGVIVIVTVEEVLPIYVASPL